MKDSDLSIIAKNLGSTAATVDWKVVATNDLRKILQSGDAVYYYRTGMRAVMYAIAIGERPYLIPLTAMVAHAMGLRMSDEGGMIWPDAQYVLSGGLGLYLFNDNDSLKPVLL